MAAVFVGGRARDKPSTGRYAGGGWFETLDQVERWLWSARAIRNNDALTEAELEMLAQRADGDTSAALALSIVAVVNANPPAKPADKDETRVSAHGYGRFKACAKVAGGRSVPAGRFSYAHEAQAWRAAAAKLQEFVCEVAVGLVDHLIGDEGAGREFRRGLGAGRVIDALRHER